MAINDIRLAVCEQIVKFGMQKHLNRQMQINNQLYKERCEDNEKDNLFCVYSYLAACCLF